MDKRKTPYSEEDDEIGLIQNCNQNLLYIRTFTDDITCRTLWVKNLDCGQQRPSCILNSATVLLYATKPCCTKKRILFNVNGLCGQCHLSRDGSAPGQNDWHGSGGRVVLRWWHKEVLVGGRNEQEWMITHSRVWSCMLAKQWTDSIADDTLLDLR